MNGESEPQWTPRAGRMERAWLGLITGITAIAAAAGGIGLLTRTVDLGDTVTSRLPFGSIALAGAALLLVVALPMTVVSYLTAHGRREYAAAAMGAGALLVCWIAGEVAVIRVFSWLQVVFVVVGFVVLVMGLHSARSALTTHSSR